MRALGLLGGATWRATARYYDGLNLGVEARLGAGRSARLLVHSIDYGDLRAARATGRWRTFGDHLARACRGLRHAGAEGLVLCSNTFHALAEPIADVSGLPVLHVADVVGAAAVAAGHRRVGLLGTAFTVTQPFYVARLRAHGLEVVVPDADTIGAIDDLLLGRLAVGPGSERDRAYVAERARALAADAVILGCTELSLLGLQSTPDLALLDALALHIDAGVAWLTSDATEPSGRAAPGDIP